MKMKSNMASELPLAPRPSPLGTVYVLDDEPEMLKALTRLLRAKRFEVRAFTSASAFLKAYPHVATIA